MSDVIAGIEHAVSSADQVLSESGDVTTTTTTMLGPLQAPVDEMSGQPYASQSPTPPKQPISASTSETGIDKNDASDSVNGASIDDQFELVDTRQKTNLDKSDAVDDKGDAVVDKPGGVDEQDDANDSDPAHLRRSRRRHAFRPLCGDCGADCSAIWTRVNNNSNSQILLCHTCATIRDSSATAQKQQQQQRVPGISASTGESRGGCADTVEENTADIEGATRRLRRCVQRNQRRQQLMASAANTVSASSALGRGRGRRTLLKKQPIKSPAAVATTVTTEFLFHKGVYYQIGDVVSLRSLQHRVYYAQIRGLLQDQYTEKSAVITWLIPTTSSPPPEHSFDPATYIIGPDEDLPRRLDCMQFVCRAPSDYYKLRNSPYPTAAPHLAARGAKFVYTRLGPVAMRQGEWHANSAESE